MTDSTSVPRTAASLMVERRGLVRLLGIAGGAFLLPGVAASCALTRNQASNTAGGSPSGQEDASGPVRPPALEPTLVHEFVLAAHTDEVVTRQLLAEEPGLLNATWDWGGGDFETALGGASHMGRRDIIGILLAAGARIDLFCAATMDMLPVVEAVVNAYPDAVGWSGPHGISLLRHAQAGESQATIEYLESVGAS